MYFVNWSFNMILVIENAVWNILLVYHKYDNAIFERNASLHSIIEQ